MLKLLQMSVLKSNDAFLDYLCQFIDVNEDSMQELIIKAREAFKTLHLKKNEFFVKENEVCQHFCFVESGILQHSIEVLDEEKTTYLALRNSVTSSLSSFLFGNPSEKTSKLLPIVNYGL